MKSPFSLFDKKIFITGASAGIGRSIAVHCSNQGANIYLTARNEDEEGLQKTKEMLTAGEHLHFTADLNSDEEIHALAEHLSELDGLVLNAGIVKTVPIRFIQRDYLDKMFNVNIQGSIILIQKLLKLKKIKAGGSICFISSVSSNYVQLGNSIYSATKGAMNSFTKALALELAPKQIRVNAILPGMVQTDILKNSSISQEHLLEHKKNYPLGRFGKPEDIAHLSVYLMSDVSQWMTGSLLTIDGGFSIK